IPPPPEGERARVKGREQGDASSHGDGGARDIARAALMLEPVRLPESIGNALEREHVRDDALEGKAPEIAAQEGERLLERPRRVVGRRHEADVAATERRRRKGEDV